MLEMKRIKAIEYDLRNSLMDKYPGVTIPTNTEGMTIRNMELLLSKNYEELPEEVRPIADRLMCNAELAKIIGRNLDWYYTTEQAKEYMADQKIFKGSFALLRNERHSAQFLLKLFDSFNLIIREVHMKRGSVHLVGDRKYRDISGYCPKKPILNKEVLPVRPDNPELFMKVMQQLISHTN